MIELKKAFKHRGFIYELVSRGKYAACYQLTAFGKRVGYESFIIQQSEPMANFGKTLNVNEGHKEKLPSNEQFGSRAFFFMPEQREEALEKFTELEAYQKRKKEDL